MKYRSILIADFTDEKMTDNLLRLRSRLIYNDSQLMDQVLRRELFRINHTKKFKQLTEREVEVLTFLGDGFNNPMIAKNS